MLTNSAASLPHSIAYILRRERIGLDVDVDAITRAVTVQLRALGLHNDGQVVRVHAEGGQARAHLGGNGGLREVI